MLFEITLRQCFSRNTSPEELMMNRLSILCRFLNFIDRSYRQQYRVKSFVIAAKFSTLWSSTLFSRGLKLSFILICEFSVKLNYFGLKL